MRLMSFWFVMLVISAEKQASPSEDGLEYLNELVRSFSKSCDAAVTGLSPDEDGECENGGMAANLILSGFSALLTIGMFRCIGTSYIAAISAGVAIAAIVSSIVSAIMLG
jgi:hypothetical protein